MGRFTHAEYGQEVLMSLLGNNIIGNEALRAKLYSEIKSGTLSHAYIIEGKKGSGRHTLAKNIIAALACENKGGTVPCGSCKSCRHIFEDKCPDVITINKKDKASVGIEAIRNIKSELLVVPNDLEIKAYIIEESDLMTTSAQNAFLLSMEEPPKFVSFFLLCENARSMLETIRSRAPILRTEPIPSEMIGEYICSDKVPDKLRESALSLKRNEPSEFDTVLMASDGSIGRAIELLSPRARKPISDRRALAESFIEALKTNSDIPVLLFNRFSQKREELILQLEFIKSALRDLILLKKSENAPLGFYTDREAALDISSMFFERKLVSVFDLVDTAETSISKNANVKLTIISLLTKI